MPPPVLEVPRAEIPSYKPLVVPPNTLRPPPGVKSINTRDGPQTKGQQPRQPNTPLPPEAQIVEIPFTDIEVAVPTTTIMTTAATTAFVSVAATLTATSGSKWLVKILKPIFKKVWSKITKQKESKDS